MEKYKKVPVKVTKLQDSKFGGLHPNGINEGYEAIGNLRTLETDDSMYVSTQYGWFVTSPVTKIEENEDHMLVHTQNSIYKVEEYVQN